MQARRGALVLRPSSSLLRLAAKKTSNVQVVLMRPKTRKYEECWRTKEKKRRMKRRVECVIYLLSSMQTNVFEPRVAPWKSCESLLIVLEF